MNAKQEVIKFIEQLPDAATLEDIMEELYFRQKVQKGLEDEVKGRLISHEEAKKRLGQWLEK